MRSSHCSRRRDQRLLLVKPRHPDCGLADADNLSRFDRRRSDDPVAFRHQGRVVERVARQFARPLRPGQPSLRLLDGGGGAVMCCLRLPAGAAQVAAALLVGARLFQRGRRRLGFGAGLRQLQSEIRVVEPRQHIPGLDPLPDIHQPPRHLAGDAKCQVELHPRPDHRDEAARLLRRPIADRGHQHRPRWRLDVARRIRRIATDEHRGDRQGGGDRDGKSRTGDQGQHRTPALRWSDAGIITIDCFNAIQTICDRDR